MLCVVFSRVVYVGFFLPWCRKIWYLQFEYVPFDIFTLFSKYTGNSKYILETEMGPIELCTYKASPLHQYIPR